MDLRLGEQQDLIRESAREFLEKECPIELVRTLEHDPQGYSADLWKQMAEMGYLGLPLPEPYGGMEGNFLDLCTLIEELGRFRALSPFFSTVVLCALPLARFGTDAQKSQYLSGIAGGNHLMAYAEIELGTAPRLAAVELTATPGTAGYVLDGQKRFVPYASVADTLLVAAASPLQGEHGITLFLVDANSPGVACERLETVDLVPQYKVTFEQVPVPEQNVLGRTGDGWPVVQAINHWGAAAQCAEMIGGAERVLEMSVDYAKTRTQFDQPIGSFQAIQHHCANIAADVVSSRMIAYEAIWRLSEGLDAAKEVSMAKAWVSDAYSRVCALGHQIHGAIGFTKEHDMHLYSRHARAAELAFGDGDYHRERVTQQLGL